MKLYTHHYSGGQQIMDLQSEPFNYSKLSSWLLTEKYPVSFDEKQSCVGFPAHESIPLFLWEMLPFGWNLFSKTEFQKVKQLLKIPLSYSCNTMKSLGPRNKHEYLFNWYSRMHRLIGMGRILEYYGDWNLLLWVINHFWVLSKWMVAYI